MKRALCMHMDRRMTNTIRRRMLFCIVAEFVDTLIDGAILYSYVDEFIVHQCQLCELIHIVCCHKMK